MKKLSFDEASAILKKLNIKYYQASEWQGEPGIDRREVFLPKFTSVLLPFSAEEWCSLTMREGEHYCGGCCASLATVQDIIVGIFLSSGYADIEDLLEVAEIIVSHDGDDSDFKILADLQQAVDSFSESDPWKKMAVIWHLVKDNWTITRYPHPIKSPYPNENDLRYSLRVLGSGLQSLSEHNILSPDYNDYRNVVRRVQNLHRVLPALKIVWEQIESLNPGQVTGYALVDINKPDSVLFFWFGYCIFETLPKAQEVQQAWQTDRLKIAIRPVRVSMGNGLEFLDG